MILVMETTLSQASPMTVPSWVTVPTWIIAALGLSVTVAVLAWKVARWTQRVDSATDGWKTVVDEIRSDIKKIFLHLQAPAAREPLASDSPMRLTEFGEEIAKGLNAKAWAKGIAPRLLGKVQDLEDYEVDEFCHNYVKNDLADDMKARVASNAYSFGIERNAVRGVLRVVLRDELLSPR